MPPTFQLDDLIGACLRAADEPDPQLAMRDVLGRAVDDPGQITDALPPERAEIVPLHSSDRLTVAKVVWAPGMRFRPHDHRMWAAIAIYQGAEDNALYRRTPRRLMQAGGRQLRQRDVLLLGADAVHAVTNPLRTFSAAIHVYGGNLFEASRSEWDPDTLEEQPYDLEAALAYFEQHNAALPARTRAVR